MDWQLSDLSCTEKGIRPFLMNISDRSTRVTGEVRKSNSDARCLAASS